MKNSKKAVLLIVALLLVSAVLCTGCGGGGDNSSNANKFANTKWKVTEVEAAGSKVTGDLIESSGYSITLEFGDDDKVTMNALGVEQEGTYKVDGSKMTLTMNGQDQEVKIDGNKLTMEESGAKITFTK